MLQVVTAAPDQLLIKVATVKLKLGIAEVSQDAILTRLVEEASDAVKSEVKRDLARQIYLETTAGSGTTDLQLSRYPVETAGITALLESDPADFSVSDPQAGILYARAGWRWSAQLAPWYELRRQPGTEVPNVSVTYGAGYILPNWDTSALPGFPTGYYILPLDIERAAWLTVKEWWLEDRRDVAITQRSSSYGSKSPEAIDPLNTMTIQYAPRDPYTARALPPEARSLLRQYVKNF